MHSGGRTELLDELLDNAAAGIEIDGGQEAGMLIPRNMRGPACSALLPRPFLPPPPFTYQSLDRVALRVSSPRSSFPRAEAASHRPNQEKILWKLFLYALI